MEAKAYDEILDFFASGKTAESIVAFRPSAESLRRVQQLVERRQSGELSEDEDRELEEYLQFEHLMIMAKARARSHLSV